MSIPAHCLGSPALGRRWVTVSLLLLPLVAILCVGAGCLPQMAAAPSGDLWLYFAASSYVTGGHLPYRDFPFEYPPLALFPLSLPRVALLCREMTFSTYLWAFLVEGAVFGGLLSGTVWQIVSKYRFSRSPNRALGIYAALTVTLSLLLPWRYDLFPALLTALALAAVLGKQPCVAGLWLGLGIAAKLYPAVLLPILAVYYLVGGQRRDLARLALGCLIVVTLCALPFAALPASVSLSFLKYHQMRGLEIGSLPAGIILLMHVLGQTPVSLVFNYGAFHLIAPQTARTVSLLPLLSAALYSLLLVRCRRDFRAAQTTEGSIAPQLLVRFLVGALLVFILTNKVFSPQYMIWLTPFVPLLPRRQAALALVIFALTILIYPLTFNRLLALETGPILLLNLRNFLTLIFLGLLLAEPKALESKAYSLPTASRETYV